MRALHAATLALVAACSIPDKELVSADAPVADAPAIDAPAIDAIDAPTDASPDAIGTCDPGLTYCGVVTGCVDLQTSSANCGACGYEVRGTSRTCVSGKPTPGWVAMAQTPNQNERPKLISWTGRRYMLITDTEERFYDPVANAWSADNAFAHPAFIGVGISGELTWARVPGQNQVAVWEGTHTTDGDELYFFNDDGGNGSWTAKGPNVELGTRRGSTVIATPTDVFVAFGLGFDNAVRYNLTDFTFTKSGELPAGICGGGLAHYMNPFAVVSGSVMTHGGYRSGDNGHCMATSSSKASLPTMTAWTTGATGLGIRTGHIFMEYNGYLLYGGGRASGGGGGSCAAQGLHLIDVTGTVNNVTAFTQPPLVGSDVYSVRTGRGVMIWGGRNPACNNTTLATYNTGSIGIPAAAGVNITWSVLPTNSLVGRFSIPNDHAGWGSAQPLWSGYEAMVFGGSDGTSIHLDGATYQPPVGCVCPDAATEACAGITNASTTCAP